MMGSSLLQALGVGYRGQGYSRELCKEDSKATRIAYDYRMRSENIEAVHTSKNDILHAATSQLATITYKTIKLQTAPWFTAMKPYVKIGLRRLKKRELTWCRRTLKFMTLVSKETGDSGV